MPKQKKGKSRAAIPAQEDGGEESGLAPIPEDGTGYEGFENYGQRGETWQNEQAAWPDYAQGDQWGHQPGPQPGPQTGAWDTGQYPQQQEWGPPTTSPVNAVAHIPAGPAGPAAFAAWGRPPQGAYGTPGPPHATQQPPPPGPPPGMPPSRSRQDPGLPAGTTSWQHWGAEAMANSRQFGPPPTQPPAGYGQQGRVAFASHDSYIPFVDRAETTPQAQRQMFDSIMNSRGGAPAPRQPQQRPTRGSTQHSTHSTKQSRKSKKEKRAQEQDPPNPWDGQQQDAGWEQGNQGWEQENTQWGEEKGYGWSQQEQEPDWRREKQDPAWDQDQGWGGEEAGRDDLEIEGHGGEAWNDGRGNYQQPVSSPFFQPPAGASPYSRTMAHAYATVPVPFNAPSPGFSSKHSTISDYMNLDSMMSFGEALKPVEHALFGRERKARDRIHWQFPHDKDERVRDALEWLHSHARSVGAFGLNKFLQSRERGALFVNASYDSPSGSGPALDWLTYEDVVETRDRLLQESVGHYDPSSQVIVFVFLPSKSGNSLAMWRRKFPVPESIRLTNLREIDIVKAALRKDYTVWVDEMRSPPYRLSLPSGAPPKKKKKQGFFRRLFRIFKIVW